MICIYLVEQMQEHPLPFHSILSLTFWVFNFSIHNLVIPYCLVRSFCLNNRYSLEHNMLWTKKIMSPVKVFIFFLFSTISLFYFINNLMTRKYKQKKKDHKARRGFGERESESKREKIGEDQLSKRHW
jgi:hypothetical protein